MINQKAIGYITTNYASRESSTLLKSRPLASLPFVGRYRLIDFPLSNMSNAGIRTVGLVMPGNFRSIIDHIGSGRDWMLDRKKGGMFLLPGNAYGTSKRGMRFLLRDIISNKMLFLRSRQPYVVMCGSNILFNLDLNVIIDAHEASGAGITMVYHRAERDQQDVSALEIGEAGRVRAVRQGCGFGDCKFLDCFIINRDILIDVIDHYASADYLDLFEAVAGDFERIDVCSYEFKGLSIGIFDEDTYFRRSMELLDPDCADQLFRAGRPIRTKAHDYPPAKYDAGSYVCNSLISVGCVINGTVRGSILSRGVTIESGASVTSSIIMQSCVIRRGARIESAIIDKNNVVAQNTELSGTPESILVIGKVTERSR